MWILYTSIVDSKVLGLPYSERTEYIFFSQLERRDQAAAQTLRAALTKAEKAHPGLSYDIVVGILKKGDIKVNMNESILRLQGGASETDR